MLILGMSRKTFINELESFPIKEPLRFKTSILNTGAILISMVNGDILVAYLRCYEDGTDIWFALGRTIEGYRRLGYGTWIRAVAAWCAKRAGYKKIYQTASRMMNTPATLRPTSAYIMNKLGFEHWNNHTINDKNRESRVLNLTRNITKVNAIIRNIRKT